MYSREYFYSLRQLSNPVNEDLKLKFQTIDTALFKEQFDNWRNNNRKSMLKKRELNDIDKIHKLILDVETLIKQSIKYYEDKCFIVLSKTKTKDYCINDSIIRFYYEILK